MLGHTENMGTNSMTTHYLRAMTYCLNKSPSIPFFWKKKTPILPTPLRRASTSHFQDCLLQLMPSLTGMSKQRPEEENEGLWLQLPQAIILSVFPTHVLIPADAGFPEALGNSLRRRRGKLCIISIVSSHKKVIVSHPFFPFKCLTVNSGN